MSSNHNDSNKIHPGNYEEFFLLYMDGELNQHDMEMVESFLEAHPHLRGELDLLMDTKLSPEIFSIDKEMLMADNMQLPSPQEDLLLYLDQELPEAQRNVVELEIASNKEYALLHEQLMKAQLDPAEIIAHPNKKELYRRTGSIVAFRPWMRVAAAVILIAGASAIYMSQQKSALPGTIAVTPGLPAAAENTSEDVAVNTGSSKNPETLNSESQSNEAAGSDLTVKPKRKSIAPVHNSVRRDQPSRQDLTAFDQQQPRTTPRDVALTSGTLDHKQVAVIADLAHSDVINNSVVTNTSTVSSDLGTAARVIPEETTMNPRVASNEKKGSVKGFLRKATRLIEKKTGIDPTNDGELLIGVVAVNLK